MADIIIAADHSDEIIRNLDLRVQAGLEACGIQAVSHAQSIIDSKIPRHAGSWYVSKGAAGLRGSISHKVRGDVCYVGTNNSHAIYNEYGTGIYADGGGGRKSPWSYKDEKGNWHRTRGISAIHFLKNALQDYKEEYKAILKKYING